jgi:2-methylcitrate dehydratase
MPQPNSLSAIKTMGFSRRTAMAGIAAIGVGGLVPRTSAAPAISNVAPAHPLAERLAVYADKLRYEDIDVATVEAVKIHFIDTIGCGIAAFDERPVRICREAALAIAGGTSSIIGTDRRSTPDLASFANGAAFRYYDLNDIYVHRQGAHPSDHIAACLAVAEAEKSSIRELITAIVVAYEINCQLTDAMDISKSGWDPPVLSLPAVALAVGKLMKLGVNKLTQAVNIAINDHIPMFQTRVQTLSDWKGLADAEAGRNAVFAAMLARGGLSGPAPIFEGRAGFFRLVSGPVNVDVDRFGGRDIPFKINQCNMKAYPAVIYAQTAIAAGIEAAKEIGPLERVTAIEIATTSRGYQAAGSEPEKWAPTTRDTADHSLPYTTARAMFDGDVTNESYTPEKLRDTAVLAFMRKIKVSEDPALTARMGVLVPTRLTVTLDDGRRIIREIDDVPGFAKRPMGRADVEWKFYGNIGKRWSRGRTAALLQSLWKLESAPSLGALLSTLSI